MGSWQVWVQVLSELQTAEFPCALGIESCLVSGAVLPAFYPWSQGTLLPRGVGGIIPILLLLKVSVALVECKLMSRKGWFFFFMQERKSMKISHSGRKYISWMESDSVLLQWDYYGNSSSDLCRCFLSPFTRAVLLSAQFPNLLVVNGLCLYRCRILTYHRI